MAEAIRVGDYVTHIDPKLAAVFTGVVKWVEGSGFRTLAIIERPAGSRSVAPVANLRKISVLDVFAGL